MSKGSLFATGLVAGGAVAGVLIAFIAGTSGGEQFLSRISLEETLVHELGNNGYYLLGLIGFALMALILYRNASAKEN